MIGGQGSSSRIIGANTFEVTPIFDQFNRHVLLVSGSDVIVLKVETGNRIAVLSHLDRIIAVHLALDDANLISTYTIRGSHSRWHPLENRMIDQDETGLNPLLGVHKSGRLFYGLGQKRLLKLDHSGNSIEFDFSISDSRHVALTEQCAFVIRQATILIYNLSTGQCVRRKEMAAVLSDNTVVFLTRLQWANGRLAVGFNTGRIIVWPNTDGGHLEGAGQLLHWHRSSAEMALTASSLYSAGGEGVLVRWTNTMGTVNKEFLPRLGVAVYRIAISSDGQLIAVILADNSLHLIVAASLRILSSPPSLLMPIVSPSIGLIRDSLTTTVLTNARPGHIQWIDPITAITLATAPPDINQNLPIEMSDWCEVTAIALSSTSMATFECRRHDRHPDATRLKIWRRESNKKPFDCQLEFSIDNPCAMEQMMSIRLGEAVLAISTREGSIILWRRNGENKWTMTDDRLSWQNRTLHDMDLCEDVLAALYSQVLVLWDVVDGVAFHVEVLNGDSKRLKWMNDGLLLIAGSDAVFCWDTRSLQPLWIVLQPYHIDSIGEYVLLFDDNKVALLNAENGQLIATHEIGEGRQMDRALLLWPDDDSIPEVLCQSDDDRGLVRVSWADKSASSPVAYSLPTSNCSKTPFAALSTLIPTVEPEIESTRRSMLARPAIHLLSQPAHTLAPIAQLAPVFLRSCLQLREEKK